MKGAIIYDTKYGSTLKAAQELNEQIPNTELFSVDAFNFNETKYSFVVLGCYVYKNTMSQKMLDFVQLNQEQLKQLDVFAYVMMLEGDSAQKYLQPMMKRLGDSIRLMQSFGGVLKLDQLDQADYDQIKKQLTALYLPIRDLNLYSSEAVSTFAQKINTYLMKRLQSRALTTMYKQCIKQLMKHQNATLEVKSISPLVLQYQYLNDHLYVACDDDLERFLKMNVTLRVDDPMTKDTIWLTGILHRLESLNQDGYTVCINAMKWRTSQFSEIKETYFFER